jgi:two-component system nitrogen regulation response regulator NtrX
VSRRILIIDDEQGIRTALGQLLEYEGYEVRSVATAADGLAQYGEWKPQLVFMDVKLPGIDGLEGLRRLRAQHPDAAVVMISGHGTIQTAVEATQLGAYDFLEKPLDTDRVLLTVRNAMSHLQLQEENARLKQSIEGRYEIVGESPAIRALLRTIEKIGPTPARVLITGENGTGKELVARALHLRSPRARRPFVEVNCAAIPSELIESELFGHVKGSFTGAIADRSGKFEQADTGTLFLDEVGDMSAAAQAKVLRVLEDGVLTRIGGSRPVAVDVRVITATNKNLPDEIAAGRFREDLYYRLNVIPVTVPPLRERRQDIPLLTRYFAAQIAEREGTAPRRIRDDAIERLAAHDWPGNVRELRNTVERLLILAAGPEITAADVDALVSPPRGARETADRGSAFTAPTFERFKEQAEREYILTKLREFDWNVSETARALDMPRSNLYKKIERYGLQRGG